VDDVLQSYPVTVRASIKFVNRSSTPVDIYWINFDGHRVLYRAGLAVNADWTAGTFLTHPWLVVVSGTLGAPRTGHRAVARWICGPECQRRYGDHHRSEVTLGAES
jgi:hypothetical protein